jgi:hypothetical protein
MTSAVNESAILHLTLKQQWFEQIASGQKREEYREIKPYWSVRLLQKKFDVVQFRNGYRKNAPTIRVELKEIISGLGVLEWGAPLSEQVYILRLGKIVSCNKSALYAGANYAFPFCNKG